jgi:hypothetical protein
MQRWKPSVHHDQQNGRGNRTEPQDQGHVDGGGKLKSVRVAQLISRYPDKRGGDEPGEWWRSDKVTVLCDADQ